MTISEIRRRDKIHLERNPDDGNMRYNLWGRLVLKRLSYYPVWLFMKMGLSANAVTGLSFLMGCVGCALLAFGGYTGTIVGALLLNLWALLDYADGQVARLRKSGSNYGRFLDNLADTAMAGLLFVCLGIGAARLDISVSVWESGGVAFGILGGWTSACYLYLLLVAYNYERLISPQLQSEVASLRVRGLPPSLAQIAGYNLCNVTGIIMPFLVLGAIFGVLGYLVLLWAAIATLAVAFMTYSMIRRAKRSG